MMNKEIYLFRGTPGESYADFTNWMKNTAQSVAETRDVHQVRLVWTAEAPPSWSIIPFRKQKAATLSVVKEDEHPVAFLLSQSGFAGAYRVAEALPVKYEKSWPDGEPTAGPCLLTLFNRKKGLDTAAFLNRWHNSHTPLSLKIHPLWNYNRNVVEHPLTKMSEPWEGIVEEQTRTDADLLNPFRFFGGPARILKNMLAVYRDTNAFLDYKGIETYFAREIVIMS